MADPALPNLTTGLQAWWKLDEESGNAADAHGSHTLTNNNTVTFVPGKVGSAAALVIASNHYFSEADTAAFSMGNNDLSFVVWVKFDSVASDQALFGKWVNSAGDQEYFCRLDSVSGFIDFAIYDGTNFIDDVSDDTTILIDTWYMVVVYHDAANNLIGISVNGSQFITSATGGTAPGDSTTEFTLGALSTPNNLLGGNLDEVAVWRDRVLLFGDVNWLYNGGNGRTYKDVFNPLVEADIHLKLAPVGDVAFVL